MRRSSKQLRNPSGHLPGRTDEIHSCSRGPTPQLQVPLVARPRNQFHRHLKVACFWRPFVCWAAVNIAARFPRSSIPSWPSRGSRQSNQPVHAGSPTPPNACPRATGGVVRFHLPGFADRARVLRARCARGSSLSYSVGAWVKRQQHASAKPGHVIQRRRERMFVALFSFVLAEQAHHPMQFLTTIGRAFPTSRRGPVRRTVRHLRH